MADKDIASNGWTAVPVDAVKILNGKPYIHKPQPLLVDDVEFPEDDAIVAKTKTYAKEKLPEHTFNHSMRVFYFASAIIKQQFPEHHDALSPVTLALTCLLHDIGTTNENLHTTRLSFEFYGGILALNLLKDEYGASSDQAEAVCETIIRHQDLGKDGTITLLGQVIQLATLYDNVSEHPEIDNFGKIIHETTREDVNKRFPRLGWLGCFADTIRKEIELKPWCHTTHIPDFDKKVEGNTLMKPYEQSKL
ncbi:Cyanamide hydratase [Colletotrichum orbiculare MAFF 240422]|uniref:Cyanamide hydratase n=1 Tax=Colletotrichum orbiculare (strain 104-T / ATCC 96160 / CBS 514.97 / LARS 414 / MAFF 240422) TaxID=1213857 RepID=N4W5N6_COLOR|nr:Cyanamide hydratase [Colletotrichum orbiculare MAFF 240422]